MTKNVFILGLTDFQRGELETLAGAGQWRFHSLLDFDRLVAQEDFDFEKLLDSARAELADFSGSVDGIINHWDFPSSVLAPILAREHGIASPSLESVLKCEHKFWSRLEQAASVPECVPEFVSFDPFGDDPLGQIGLEFPFWIKPVKSHSSQLGFKIDSAEELDTALQEVREEIGSLGNPFDEALSLVELPPQVGDATGMTCLAEQIISGTQAAPEGTMFQGQFNAHGAFDMHKDATGQSFERLDYPASAVPEQVQQRMVEVSERFLRHIGFDNGCFNAEFMWDEPHDQLWLIEVNTRISQSHSDLFAKVDGMSNHQVAIEIALGEQPSMPRRQGQFAVATKFIITSHEDGVVTRVPSEAEIDALRERFPETHVQLAVEPGVRLGDLAHQDSYSFILAVVYLGADDGEQLAQRCQACREALPFEISPLDEVGAGAAPGA